MSKIKLKLLIKSFIAFAVLAFVIVTPIYAEEVKKEIFTANFSYPDCREAFTDRAGTQTLEPNDDGLYLSATGFTAADGVTFAGTTFDNVYDSLKIQLKWKKCEVLDSNGNILETGDGSNNITLGLKSDVNDANVNIIGMTFGGNLVRIVGNPGTSGINPKQPKEVGGYFNLEIEFYKEDGIFYVRIYDLNDDRVKIFTERYPEYTDANGNLTQRFKTGAKGFSFGVVRMGSDMSKRNQWTNAISDITVTNGTDTVYSSPLKATYQLDKINILNGKMDLTQDGNGITMKATDFEQGAAKSTQMGVDFGAMYDDLDVRFRWKKGYITDSSGNVISDAGRTVSSSYNLKLLGQNNTYIPLIGMDYLGTLSRPAGNPVTLYQKPQAAVVDNDGFYNLQVNFGRNASDGYWYSYFYDMNNGGVEIYRERYASLEGAKGIVFDISRMNTEIGYGTVWQTTLKNITVSSNVYQIYSLISDVSFTDGNDNPITIGYGADEVRVRFTVSDDVYGSYDLFLYLTGYNESELKTVQRIPIRITEADEGQTFTYTFQSSDNDMLKRVYLFDSKLMPYFNEVPVLYLINSEENGENVKYVYANTNVDVATIDYSNVRVCNAVGEPCAQVRNVYYYPEDGVVMIEVDASDECPENVKIHGLGSNIIDGTAFQGYSESMYDAYIKGLRYDRENKTIYVNILNSSNDSVTKYITVFRRHMDGSIEEIYKKSLENIEPNSNNQLVIPYSEEILGGFYAILQ